jgi:3'-phosphoadenosine 5'-phosphosulfate sulfotransferase (PAPS reductase)/FAD synthetase
MALMAAHGEIEPMPDAAIFADTQAEPKAVYEWLDWLEKQLPFPVYRVTAGSLKAQPMDGTKTWGRPPFFTQSGGMVRRQCTGDFKIAPIRRKIRQLTTGPVTLWIGISLDEAARMKPSDVKYIQHRWPLIEKHI